jgi:hypothetical protein
MIGEFCPKAFALKDRSVIRLKAVIVDLDAEMWAWKVTGTGMSTLSTAGGQALVFLLEFFVSPVVSIT